MIRFRGTLALVLLGTAIASARESYEAKPGLLVPGGLIMFLSSEGPLSYEALSPRELPPGAKDAGAVETQSCQYALSIPLTLTYSGPKISGAMGNGSFNKALSRLHAQRPELQGLYDVMVDLRDTSVLGVFTRLCTEIHARGYS